MGFCNDIWDEQDLSFYAKGVYCLLGKFTDKDGKCWPSLRKLEKASGLSRPTLIKAVKELREKNCLHIQKDKTRYGDYDFNKYYLPNLKQGVVKEIDHGGKGRLPGVVNDVDLNYTNITNPINSIYTHWNSKEIINHRTLTKKMEGHINARLENYSPEEIREAIDNYATVLHGEEYFWSYKWGLSEFLTRENGLDKFTTTSDPLNNYRKKGVPANNPSPELQERQLTDDEIMMEKLIKEMEANGHSIFNPTPGPGG